MSVGLGAFLGGSRAVLNRGIWFFAIPEGYGCAGGKLRVLVESRDSGESSGAIGFEIGRMVGAVGGLQDVVRNKDCISLQV